MEETKVLPTKVKYTGFFDVRNMYSLMYDVFTGMGYAVVEDTYKSTLGGKGEDLELTWFCEKNVDNYTRFKIKIFVLGLGIEKVKVKEGDVEVSKNKGYIELNITASIVTDWESKWETHPLLKFFKGIYDKYIYKDTFIQWKGKIVEETNIFVNEIKSFFGMQKF